VKEQLTKYKPIMTTEINSSETQIKWMCHNIFISIDYQVFDLSFKPIKERVVSGCYGYTVDGRFRSKKWIRKNCAYVLGNICND
jgi:hypothetical protein